MGTANVTFCVKNWSQVAQLLWRFVTYCIHANTHFIHAAAWISSSNVIGGTYFKFMWHFESLCSKECWCHSAFTFLTGFHPVRFELHSLPEILHSGLNLCVIYTLDQRWLVRCQMYSYILVTFLEILYFTEYCQCKIFFLLILKYFSSETQTGKRNINDKSGN